jgi:hypothetical protein
MQILQASYCKVKLLFDIDTEDQTFKSGEIHILRGISHAFMAIKVSPGYYKCLYEGSYEILEEK